MKASRRRELQKKMARGEGVCLNDVMRLREMSVGGSRDGSRSSLGGSTIADSDGIEAGHGGHGLGKLGGHDESWAGGTY